MIFVGLFLFAVICVVVYVGLEMAEDRTRTYIAPRDMDRDP